MNFEVSDTDNRNDGIAFSFEANTDVLGSYRNLESADALKE